MTGGQTSWLDMRPQDFDTDEPLTLFDVPDVARAAATAPVRPDRCGTPDMFADVS